MRTKCRLILETMILHDAITALAPNGEYRLLDKLMNEYQEHIVSLRWLGIAFNAYGIHGQSLYFSDMNKHMLVGE